MVRMRGFLLLCAGTLAPTVGKYVASLTQHKDTLRALAFGSCAGVRGSSSSESRRCAADVAAKTPTMALGSWWEGRGGSKPESAGGSWGAAVSSGAHPAFWLAFSPPSTRQVGGGGCRGEWGVPTLSAAAKDSDKGVFDKQAEFYGNSAPGAVAPAGAEKQDKAAVDYAVAGEWEKSLKLIEAMRDSNFVPSVNAYVATIEACRRKQQYDQASALFREMNEVCLPEDLIKEYAAPHPKAPGVTQTQKVFCLAMMMRQDKIEPFEETYRAIMGLASKEELWQVSLLLVEHIKRDGLVPGKFVYDEICSVLFKTGHPEMATMMFEDALAGDVGELKSFAPPKLDLHNHTVSTALAAVRLVLSDMVRKPTTRAYHDPTQELQIITGMGNNSKDGEAVIKPRVMELLRGMGLEPSMMRNNEGCVVLQPADLQAYVKRAVAA